MMNALRIRPCRLFNFHTLVLVLSWAFLRVADSETNKVDLPTLFNTTKGVEIKNAKVLSQALDSVKLMHEGGIVTLSVADLPAEVAQLLGLTIAEATPETKPLPETLTIKERQFRSVKLSGIDPDGIRILHAEGGGKIMHEDLPRELLIDYGPFDPQLALSFREQQKEQQRALYKIRLDAIKSENAQAGRLQGLSQSSTIPHNEVAAELLENPTQVSMPVYVELAAQSIGGKNRDTPFSTNYGSFVNEDTSTRSMICTIKSIVALPQRVRMQCIMISRPLAGGALQADVVGETLVELGPNAQKTISTSATVESTDEKYVALGLRFKSGEKYIGWCWRAIDGANRVCVVRSSIPHYDRFGWQTPIK